MTSSPRVLALMALMREIEEPSKIYSRSIRQASAAFTDSPEWDRAVGRGNAALDAIETAVRAWVAKNPAPFTAEELAIAQADVDALDAEFPDEPETGTQQCGHDDYHDAHEWADRPGIWCPGHSFAAEDTHVVADDSDDPEHVDDCPGCVAPQPAV